mmetsp:Transcript_54070/g.157055  ORF Transcript_54070/g.157055 Transcript_54070/m.157055 type:complete len:342 (+) Transcript_54070:316-1341(+)
MGQRPPRNEERRADCGRGDGLLRSTASPSNGGRGQTCARSPGHLHRNVLDAFHLLDLRHRHLLVCVDVILLQISLGDELLDLLHHVLDLGHFDDLIHGHLAVLDDVLVHESLHIADLRHLDEALLHLPPWDVHYALLDHRLGHLDDLLLVLDSWGQFHGSLHDLRFGHRHHTLDDLRLRHVLLDFLGDHMRDLDDLLHGVDRPHAVDVDIGVEHPLLGACTASAASRAASPAIRSAGHLLLAVLLLSHLLGHLLVGHRLEHGPHEGLVTALGGVKDPVRHCGGKLLPRLRHPLRNHMGLAGLEAYGALEEVRRDASVHVRVISAVGVRWPALLRHRRGRVW